MYRCTADIIWHNTSAVVWLDPPPTCPRVAASCATVMTMSQVMSRDTWLSSQLHVTSARGSWAKCDKVHFFHHIGFFSVSLDPKLTIFGQIDFCSAWFYLSQICTTAELPVVWLANSKYFVPWRRSLVKTGDGMWHEGSSKFFPQNIPNLPLFIPSTKPPKKACPWSPLLR